MHDFFASSVYFGVFLSLAAHFAGVAVRKKTGLSVFNPLLVSVILVIALLSFLQIDYAAYNQSTNLLSSLLTPATICLAVPLYEQLELLKRHRKAIFLGVLTVIGASVFSLLL